MCIKPERPLKLRDLVAQLQLADRTIQRDVMHEVFKAYIVGFGENQYMAGNKFIFTKTKNGNQNNFCQQMFCFIFFISILLDEFLLYL